MKERLQKILSRAGVASRREAEGMIEEGRIVVNGAVVTDLGTRAEEGRDAIRVDGKRLRASSPERITVALNKPRGVVSSCRDPEGRPTVADLVKRIPARLYPVGRLDYNAEGLLLLTNDGDLAFRLLRPGGAERVYRVKVRGVPAAETIERLRQGIVLDGKKTLPARIGSVRPARIAGRQGGRNAWLRVGLHEGRKNQLIRMFERVGHPVLRLRRVAIGPLELGTIPTGRWRVLTEEDVARLLGAVGRPAADRIRPPRGRPTRGKS
jgi:pseudouridine synthase